MYKREELLQAIITASPVAYIVTNELGKIVYVNPMSESISGYTLEELVNKEFNSICSFPESIKRQAAPNTGPCEPQAAIISRKDGSRVTLPASIYEIRELLNKDDFCGYIVILHTERKLMSNVDKAQMEFVSTVSHELRTPLTSIRGFAETLLRTWEKLTEDVKKKYITIIKEQAERLTRLVEDLLAVSRLEPQMYKLTVRAVDLRKTISKVCDSLSTKTSNHKIDIKIEDNIPNVKADPDRLEQILTNLVDNAIKYSPNGTTVKIIASSLANDTKIKDKVKIEVTDQGIGIKESDLSKIFTKFGRLDNPLTRQTQGTGLGLFITKALVLGLKGEISAKSKPGETTFTVILPAEIPHEAIPLSSSAEVRGENQL